MIRRTIGIALGGLFVALAAIGSVSPRPAEAAGPGTWTAAAPMPVARYAHTLTLLRDGRVLMTGGSGVPQLYYAETAIYSRATNSWTPGPPMNDARTSHTATLLRDGRVLVAGGWTSGTDPATAEIYDPAANTWTLVPSMHESRWHHTATLLPDGRVLVTGGENEPLAGLVVLDNAEIYDPVSNMWTLTPNMSMEQSHHSATLLSNGRVLVVGNNIAELYDPTSGAWIPAASPGPVGSSEATLLPDGRVLLVWESMTSVYEPTTNTWASAAASPTSSQVGPRITLLGNGFVLHTGDDGINSTAASFTFDPASLSWTERGSLSISSSLHGAVLLNTGEVLVAGGQSNGPGGPPILATSELYDATAWRGVASPAVARMNHSATLLWSAKVLVAGGGSASAEMYDEATNTWSPAGTMSAPREGHAAARMNDGRVLVVGGSNGPNTGLNHLLTAEIYNPNTNSWSPAASPVLDHIGDSAVLLSDGRVLVYGGGTDTQPEIYNPAANSWSLGSFNPNAGLPGLAVRTSTGRVLTLDLATASVYTPATDTWQPTVYGVGPFAPGSATQLDGSTKIVAAGGGDLCPPAQFTSSPLVAVFDGTLETWTSAAPMATSRFAHTASALYNGRLLVAGGAHSTAFCLSGFTVALADAELYDAASNTWTSAGSMTTARQSHSATLLPSGNVLVVGGSDGVTVVSTSERYDTGINTDTDSDGYNDGLELALGQHPWSHCKTMRADLTGDGLVNSGDQGKLASKFGVRPPPSRVDQNGDKILNSGDQGLMASVFNKSVLMCA